VASPLVDTHAWTVWTVDFEMPVCKVHLLFISANTAYEKEKGEQSAPAL
jgi:hypothetical protein